MVNQCFNQVKAGLEFRLDPCHLPHTTTYFSSKTGSQMTCLLSERGSFFKIDSFSSLSCLVSADHFKGISARIVQTISGERAVALELLHDNEEFCIPLLVSRDLNNVLLDWRSWVDIYGLPMLMISEENSIIAIKDHSDLRRFFCTTLHLKHGHFFLRYRNSLGLSLLIANRHVFQQC
ncbi:DUF6101 family protein [Bartonella sp. B41]